MIEVKKYLLVECLFAQSDLCMGYNKAHMPPSGLFELLQDCKNRNRMKNLKKDCSLPMSDIDAQP